ncbi:alpha/beta hydrolase fold-containing protein [Variovorax paradoxus B4]|uniref:Alpha/beta hydrolase fold-containing protein n=1 Tax=Variovorax paradoxus B4 TaxID=1246301 RepID=T1XI12_VARPD|nr:alpha/beta hydrolase [Variovorax paradoxus]AGU52178.1 alpha/beta hydrolase fold-containing protein [Variovorax paradoxus B4]
MLHPQARALLDFIEARGIPPTHTLSPAEARAFYRERRAATQPEPPPVAEVRDLKAEGPHGTIPMRLYRPLGTSAHAALPVLVYFHGGGWVIGDLDTHDVLCRSFANGAGCAVASIDYRMGPEHRFPAAVDDVLAATRWVRREADSLGLDAGRLAVGGDSAGGNLAAVAAIAARDAGDLPIAFQLLIYPATDMRRGHPSHQANGQGYLLTRDTMTYFHDHYIEDAGSDLDWRASPLLHADLSGLPPALVLTAGYDPLRDEGMAYAEALTAAGNRAAYVCFERQIHGFITMGKVLDEADTAVALCSAELRRALAPA